MYSYILVFDGWAMARWWWRSTGQWPGWRRCLRLWGIKHMKQLVFTLLPVHADRFSSFFRANQYPCASARCKPPCSEAPFPLRISSLLCRVCDTIHLVPIRFWRMGHGRMVSMLDTAVAGGVTRDSGARVWSWHPAHEAFSSLLMFTLLPVYGDKCPCLLKIKNNKKILPLSDTLLSYNWYLSF